MKKQIFSEIAVSGVLLLMLSICNSCIKEETFAQATVETNQVTSVTEATAICGGIFSADGCSDVTASGVCWSTSPIPTIENDTTLNAAVTGSFTSVMNGLAPGTTYYVRAYAINKGGVGYGLQKVFTTKTYSITTTPIAISLVTATSAICGGNIISDGDSSTLTVIARGVCWNTFPEPTIENNKTTDGVGGGRYTSNIDNLVAFATYYVRAYATNSNGTIYGNEVSFTTLSGVILMTTNAASIITAYTATSGGTITSDGGAPVIERGICWNIFSSPTTANSKLANGSGIGTLTADISGLMPSTTYYVRSYAINSIGTFYGDEIRFTTTNIVTDNDGNVYNTVKIGNQTWMVDNLKTTKYNDGTSIPNITDGTIWSHLTTPGYCYYNNNVANKSTYGAIYNWYTIDTGKLAPAGWHVPTNAEWTTLENYLIANGYNYDSTTTSNKIAKSLSTPTGWDPSSITGSIGNDITKNNTSGFAGLPSGYRGDDGTFGGVGILGYWLSSSQYNTDDAWHRYLWYYDCGFYSNYFNKKFGLSVRCIRDY